MPRRISLLLAAGCLAWPATMRAQEARPAGRYASAAELARLQQEVRDLRQMLIQAMQVEQQHHDLLLKLLQTGDSHAPPPPLPAAADPGAREGRAARTGTVSGTVQLKGVPAGQPVYVFVENLHAAPVHGRMAEIVQKDKQFVPQVSAVPRGTTLFFPNADRVAHNVFSKSKRNTFDLGVLKTGDRGTPVVANEPGVIEIFCDIHAKMWAEVLVLPNGFFTKTTDGSFRLANVPTGERVVAAWTAGADPVRRTVQLTGDGAQVDLTLNAGARKAHNNKAGQAYSSYGE